MRVRRPIVAGQFYPSSQSSASTEAAICLDVPVEADKLPQSIVAGIVPHAGWVCSGKVAGRVFRAIHLQRPEVSTFVIFGAVHRRGVGEAAIFADGSWQTPLGEIPIDQPLAECILAETKLVQDDPDAHEAEHSIEVQLPLIKHLFPAASIVAIMVPPDENAPKVGAAVARVLAQTGADAVCIGSTDLTHYGPSYAFTPKGPAPQGIRWAKEVNDRKLLDNICNFDPHRVLEHAETSHSACGAGAIAAAIAAASGLGADYALILEQTTSAEVLADRCGPMTDAVGYAAVVFGNAVQN